MTEPSQPDTDSSTGQRIAHALLALRWEIRAHQRRLLKDDGDANYCEIKADAEAAKAEAQS
jgi:hypothetical protein